MIFARSKRHDSAICNGTESQRRKVTEYQPPSRVQCGRCAPRRFLISVTSGTPSKESFEFIPLSIAGHASKRSCKEHGRDARATFRHRRVARASRPCFVVSAGTIKVNLI